MNKGDKVKFKESVTIKDLKQFTNVNLKKIPECSFTIRDKIELNSITFIRLEEDFYEHYWAEELFIPVNENLEKELEIIKTVKKHCKEECILECCKECSLYSIMHM